MFRNILDVAAAQELGAELPGYPYWVTVEAFLAAQVLINGGWDFDKAIRCGKYVLAEVCAEHDRKTTELLDLVSKKAWVHRFNAGYYYHRSYHEAMRRARKVIDLGGTVNDVLAAAANP